MSIVYDLRLPPDPKLNQNRKALMPDLDVIELDSLRQIIRGIEYWAAQNISYGKVVFGARSDHFTQQDIRNALRALQPLFKKISGE